VSLEAARHAFARRDWLAARARFAEALEGEESAAALDGLGRSLWWLGNLDTAFSCCERAVELYRAAGEYEPAADLAVFIAGEYRIGGNTTLASGWLARARGFLQECEDCGARSWFHIELSKRAHDAAEVEREATLALEIARRLGDAGLESCSLSHIGIAHIARAQPEHGLALMDEAMAIAMAAPHGDPLAICDASCTVLMACERVADPVRARDWARSITEFVQRNNFIPVNSWCRAVYGGLLITTGRWNEAERELRRALQEAKGVESANRSTALAYLAYLRLHQGRLEETRQLLEGLEDRPAALPSMVALHLAAGELDLAAQRVEQQLEAAHGDDRRAPLLALGGTIAIARDDAGAALAAAGEMRAAGERLGRADVVASATVLRSRAETLAGATSDPQALRSAIHALRDLEMPLAEGEARLELARTLGTDRPALAVAEARTALAIFERLGAARRADETAALLRDLGSPGRRAPRTTTELTAREQEVLALLAHGLSNPEIADRLVISRRTAEHHVRSILAKLDLANRAEAAAYAARAGIGSASK
jgi:DNA-binding CsgD family transcriptional regulator